MYFLSQFSSLEYGPGRNPAKRARAESATYQQYSQVPSYAYNAYDGSLTVLIDRMFSHLSKESEIMKDWIKLERERADRDAQRRKEEQEREERLEKLFMETLTKMQEQTFNFLANFTGVNRNQMPMNALNVSEYLQNNGSTTDMTNNDPSTNDPHCSNFASVSATDQTSAVQNFGPLASSINSGNVSLQQNTNS